MIIYEAQGGETETQGVDFQGFHGEISYATVMYPDGKEEVVRGLSFYGTPLQSLQNVIAVGNTYKMENHFCGAESGFIPVTTIAPPVLLRSLELHSRDDEQ